MRESFLSRIAAITHRERVGAELARPRSLSIYGVKPVMPTIAERVERWMMKRRMILGMDGPFYHDTRTPFISADLAAVTLATTNKALYPVSAFPVLGGQYYSLLGKKTRIRLFGRITTVLTPGNGQFNILYGTGADANGVNLASSVAFALTASQTNLSWEVEVFIHCRATGSTGTLFCTGKAWFNNAVVATSLQPLMIPPSAPVVSAAVDLTAALIPSVQFLRSGSTAETMQVHDMDVTPYN